MARDYNRKRSVRRQKNSMKHLFVVMFAFLSGYLSATIFDLTSLSGWVSSHFGSKSARVIEQAKAHEALPKPKFEFYTILANDKDVRSAAQSAALAKVAPVDVPAPPTGIPVSKEIASVKAAAILADNRLSKKEPVHVALPAPTAHAQLSAPVADVAPIKAPVIPASHDIYIVQVAAYKTRQDAERLKANLVLKGYDVQIASVSQQNGLFYRVVLGPYDSHDKASKAQVAVSQSERLTGMIRRGNV